MIEVPCDIGLEDAGFLGIVHRTTAIDEAFRDMADFGYVKMRRDRLAIRQDKTRRGIRVSVEDGFELAQLHVAKSICLHRHVVKLFIPKKIVNSGLDLESKLACCNCSLAIKNADA